MTLASEVQGQIRRYVVGFDSADTLCDWLSARAQSVLDAEDPELRRLMDLTFSLLEDVFQEQRTDEQARRILEDLIRSPREVGQTGSFQVSAISFSTLHVATDMPTESRTYGGNAALTEPLRGLLPAG